MGRKWRSDSEFKPWAGQRKRGLIALGIGLGLGALAYALPYYPQMTWALAALGVVAFSVGMGSLRQAANRAFGKSFEAEWAHLAKTMLGPGYAVETGVRVRGAGDIDVFVQRKADAVRVVVEIKSFVYWRASFFGLIPGDREKRAFAQAADLQRRIGAEVALIWLPQGRPSFWQWLFPPKRAGVRVVMGGLPSLRSAIEKIER